MTRADPTPLRAGQEFLDRDRKAEHIRLALEERMQLGASYFDGYRFEHAALPEIDLAEIDCSVEFLGRRLRAPLLVSCMTGGTEAAKQINRNLALAAEKKGIAIGIGSQRKAIEQPERAESFLVRDLCPSVPLIGNLGAVQLNYGFGLQQCEAAVSMIDADALAFHFNPLQEALQPEGQCNFKGLLAKIADVAARLSVPLIAKEIGCGISGELGKKLLERGVSLVDTAGLGGTSWARIEGSRANDVEIGERFADWGIPTPESIQALASVEGLTVIGSGGVRNGIDVAKALALGASVAGMASPFLHAAVESPEKVEAMIDRTVRELKICMFCTGARTIADLRGVKLSRRMPR